MKKAMVYLLAVMMLALAPPALQATTLVRLSLEQLSRASSAIVRGHVVSQSSHWNLQHTQIVTDTVLAVEEVMKGSPSSTVLVRQLGGTVGNWHVSVPGSPRLLPHASYVLFLEPAREPTGFYLVVGMMEGAYPVYRDSHTGRYRVVRPFGAQFVKAAMPSSGFRPDTVPLAQFRQDVARALKTPIVVPPGTPLPILVESASFEGVGRAAVRARVTATLFPSEQAVIPRGSVLEGAAQMVSGKWRIHWTGLSVAGARTAIRAVSLEPAGPLEGRMLIVEAR